MDKNDSPPKFYELPPAINVSEDLGAGHAIATIRAVDPDTIGSLSFSLVDDGSDGDEDNAANKFDLEPETGVLRLRDTLDREAKEVYRLTMRVSDGVQYTDAIVNVQVSVVNCEVGWEKATTLTKKAGTEISVTEEEATDEAGFQQEKHVQMENLSL